MEDLWVIWEDALEFIIQDNLEARKTFLSKVEARPEFELRLLPCFILCCSDSHLDHLRRKGQI